MIAIENLAKKIVDYSFFFEIFFGLLLGISFIILGATQFLILLAGLLILFLLFRSPFLGLCMLIFSFPFSGLLQFDSGGVLFSTANKMLAYVIVVAFFFSLVRKEKSQVIEFPGSLQWYFLFSLWCLFSLLWTPDQTDSFKVLMVRLNLLGLAFLVSAIPNGLKQLKTLCLCATSGAASLGIYVAVFGLQDLVGEYGLRLGAGTNENALAHSLAIGLLLSVICFEDSKKTTKILIVVFDLFILYAIALTGSRGTLVALILSAAIAPLFLPGIRLRKKLLFSAIFSVAISLLYFGITHNVFGDNVNIVFERFNVLSVESTGGRTEFIWPFYWEKFCESPIFGSGLGFKHLMPFAPHNDILSILSEFGLIGFVLFAIMQVMFFKDLMMLKDSWIRLLGFILPMFLLAGGVTHTTIGLKSYAVLVGIISFLGSYGKRKSIKNIK